MSAHPTEQHTRSRSEVPPSSPDAGRIGVSGTQVAASVLASVSAAVVASFFGVAGTIMGTAVVSVVATVGSAAYGLGIHRTRARLQQVQALRMVRPSSRPNGGGGAADADMADADVAGGVAPGGVAPGGGAGQDDAGQDDAGQDDVAGVLDPSADRWRGWLSQRRWSVAAGAAIVFVISLATVTLIELIGDRPLSGEASGSRRTSVGALFSGGDDQGDGDDDSPGSSPTTEPSTGSPSTTSSDTGTGGRSTTTTSDPGAATSTAPNSSTTVPPTTATTAPVATPTTVPVPTTAEPAPPAG
jgi:hypothetical protein